MNPIIHDLPAFDKNTGITGTFITGGQIDNHTVIIKDPETDGLLYQSTSEPGNRLNRFTIPAFEDNTLTNGRSYILYIKTTENGKEYVSSPKIIKCASAPDYFQLSIYPGENTGYTLKSTMLNVGIDYRAKEQEEDPENLNEYYVTVKDAADNKEIYRSGLVYDVNGTVEINGLENRKSYVVTAHGKTMNGMELETSGVQVNVDYEPCKDSSVLTAANDKKHACIILNSSIDSILYRTDSPPKYRLSPDLPGNMSLDLSGNTLEYYEGFRLDGDFSMYLKYIPTDLDNAVLNLTGGRIKVNFKTRNHYRLPLTAQNITPDGNNQSHFTIHDDGSMTMAITKQYGGIWFKLPDEISGSHNFDKIIIKYKSSTKDFGYGCRYNNGSSDSDITWGGLLTESGIYERTLNPEKKLSRFKFFCNSGELSDDNPASVTITSVILTESGCSLYEPYFELYNGNKMVIIDRNENGQHLPHIDTHAYSLDNYHYELILSRKNHRLSLIIRDWRR